MRPVPVQVEIARSAGDVFAYLSDFENNPRWQRGMVSCRWTSPQPHGVGATYDQVAHFLGRDVVSSFVVLEQDDGHRVKISSTSGPFPITETRTVTPDGDGRCVVDALVEGDAGGFFRIAGPLVRLMVARSVRADYRRLREHLAHEPG
jgi:hypothetical protein